MPRPIDIADTAKLYLDAETPTDKTPLSLENAADLGEARGTDSSEDTRSDKLAEQYSEGIIRFYRARTILGRQDSDDICELAWSYLTMLEPRHVPPIARPAFFALAHFMYVQALQDDSDCEQFRAHVLEITHLIDKFLDDLEDNLPD